MHDSLDLAVTLEFENQDPITFELPDIPGAPDAEDIFIEDEDITEPEVEIEEDPEEDDIWNWQSKGASSFVDWLHSMLKNRVPKHSGYDTTGLEKAISFFEALNKEITKAMRMDYKDEIDHAQAERAREQIEQGLDRLVDRLERVQKQKFKRYKKKSKAWHANYSLVKEASSATNISGIVITVPLFISRIARVIINGSVSGGHDVEDLYNKLKDEYKLTKREEAEVQQLLMDMGMPIFTDRGLPVGGQLDKYRSDNFDFGANYNS